MNSPYARILSCLSIFMAVMASAAYCWQFPVALAALYTAGTIAIFVHWRRLDDIVYYSVALVVAPLGELMAVTNGAWQYAGIKTGIPPWLPFAWGICAISLRRLTDAVIEVIKRRKVAESAELID